MGEYDHKQLDIRLTRPKIESIEIRQTRCTWKEAQAVAKALEVLGFKKITLHAGGDWHCLDTGQSTCGVKTWDLRILRKKGKVFICPQNINMFSRQDHKTWETIKPPLEMRMVPTRTVKGGRSKAATDTWFNITAELPLDKWTTMAWS